MDVVVVDDRDAVAREAADRVRTAAQSALAARDKFTIALAGGSTPAKTYAQLARSTARPGVDWNRTHLFFGDERCVPPQHGESNYRMVKEALLDHIAIPANHVHRWQAEDPAPDRAAATYERQLARPLDLALLGMGVDGHTASLFPRQDALGETTRACLAVPSPAAGAPVRLTLTMPVFLETRAILFLVTGAEKAQVLREVVHGPWRPLDLPSQTIARRPSGVTIICDRSAGAHLPSSSPSSSRS